MWRLCFHGLRLRSRLLHLSEHHPRRQPLRQRGGLAIARDGADLLMSYLSEQEAEETKRLVEGAASRLGA
jgi:hypothetical protein